MTSCALETTHKETVSFNVVTILKALVKVYGKESRFIQNMVI